MRASQKSWAHLQIQFLFRMRIHLTSTRFCGDNLNAYLARRITCHGPSMKRYYPYRQACYQFNDRGAIEDLAVLPKPEQRTSTRGARDSRHHPRTRALLPFPSTLTFIARFLNYQLKSSMLRANRKEGASQNKYNRPNCTAL